MAVVAGGQQGLGQGRAQGQNESGSLEELHKDTSERQTETSGRIYSRGQCQGAPLLRFIRPTPGSSLTWGEEGGGRRVQLLGAGGRGLRRCRDAVRPRGGGAGGQKRGGRVPWEAEEGKGC